MFTYSILPCLGGLKSPCLHPLELLPTSTLSPRVSTMAEDIKTKIKNYQTAPFDSRFPNQNQTRNCWQNYLGKQGMGVGRDAEPFPGPTLQGACLPVACSSGICTYQASFFAWTSYLAGPMPLITALFKSKIWVRVTNFGSYNDFFLKDLFVCV